MSATPALTPTIPTGGAGEVSLALLGESKLNPRRHFNPRRLDELAESIRRNGIIEPLLGRVAKNKPDRGPDCRYEIVVGARRYRAAKMAGLATVPFRIVDLTDAQVLEIQVVENGQREDVHPLEEAEGFARLLKFDGYTVELIAEKIGKDASYVYKRLKLAELIEQLKKAFFDGKIQFSHALMLCRLPLDVQQAAEKQLWEERWDGNKRVKTDIPISPRDLNEWIHRNVLFSLSAAPWKKDDPDLVPKAGSCVACPKRSGANLALFGDLKKGDDRCLDRKCYEGKAAAFIARTQESFKAAGKPLLRIASGYLSGNDEQKLKLDVGRGSYEFVTPKKTCKSAEPAIVVGGTEHYGQAVEICRDRNCTVHRPHGSGGSSSSRKKTLTEVWEEKERHLNREIETQTKYALMGHICDKVKDQISRRELNLLIHPMVECCGDLDAFAKYAGLELSDDNAIEEATAHVLGSEGVQFNRLLVRLALGFEVYGEDNPLDQACTLYKLDTKGVKAAVAGELRKQFVRDKEAALTAESKKADAKKAGAFKKGVKK